MNNQDGLLELRLLGTSLTIKTDEDPGYLKELVSYLEQKVKETQNAVSTIDSLQTSILTSIFIADELFKEKKSKNGYSEQSDKDSMEMSRIADLLISRINNELDI